MNGAQGLRMEDHARGTVGFTYEVGDLGDKSYNLMIKAGATGQTSVVIIERRGS